MQMNLIFHHCQIISPLLRVLTLHYFAVKYRNNLVCAKYNILILPFFFFSFPVLVHAFFYKNHECNFLFWRTWKKVARCKFCLVSDFMSYDRFLFALFTLSQAMAVFHFRHGRIKSTDCRSMFQYVHVTCVWLKYAYDNILYILFFIYVTLGLKWITPL